MNQPLSWKQIVFGLIIGISTIIFLFRCDSTSPNIETPQASIDNQPINDTKKDVSPIFNNQTTNNDAKKSDEPGYLSDISTKDSKGSSSDPNTKDSHMVYIAAAHKVGPSEKSPIYYKELLKNPEKFRNIIMKIRGKIMNIEEENNKTIIQLYISDHYDSIIVYYYHPIKFYKDDVIIIYATGMGTIEGNNLMGAALSLPAVRAQYIEKYNTKNWK